VWFRSHQEMNTLIVGKSISGRSAFVWDEV
jgi:hypothetical protein